MNHRRTKKVGLALAAIACLGLTACEVVPARQGWNGRVASGRLGQVVAVSGNGLVMVVSAPYAPDGVTPRVGEVEVYERTDDRVSFALSERISAPNAWADQYFGMSVALDPAGLTLAIGAPSTLGAQTGAAGRAYIYKRSGPGDEYSLASTLVPTPESGQRFGSAIALNFDATRLVVGAPRATVGSQTSAGAVYVYDTPTVGSGGEVSWTRRGNVTDLIPQGSNSANGSAYFGAAVDLDDSGNKLIVGAPYYNAVAANDGIARVYTWISATSSFAGFQPVPVQVNASEPDIRGVNANYGSAVAISGDGQTVVVGAPNRDGGKGGVISATFNSASNVWVGAHSYKPGIVVNAGADLDLNRDGSRVIIGIPGMKNSSNDITGWFAIANPLTGKELYAGDVKDYVAGEDVGRSVAISGEGNVFAVGAPMFQSSRGRFFNYDNFVVPSAPLNPAALAFNGAAMVRWSKPANASVGLRTFYAVTNVNTGTRCVTSALSCTFTGLTNGTQYNFTIVAFNDVGRTVAELAAKVSVTPYDWTAIGRRPIELVDFADLANPSLINADGTLKGSLAGGTTTGDAVTGASALPSPPTGVTAVAGRRKIAVSWEAASASTQPVLSYTVTATSPKVTKTCTAQAPATSCVLAKLGDNNPYTISVVATNSFGTGTATAVSGRMWTQPKISRTNGATLKHIARHAGLAAGKRASVTVSLRGVIAKANCTVRSGRVFAKISGPCRVRVISKVGNTTSRKTVILTAVR